MEHHYIVPAAVLGTILGCAGIFAYRTAQNLSAERGELATRTAEVEAVQARIALERTRLIQIRAAAAPANSFMSHWRGSLAPGRDGNAIVSDLSRFGNEQAVAVQNRRSSSVEYPWKGKTLHLQSAEGEGVSSEYYRLINWVGEVERNWPIVRFEQATLEQRGAAMRLFLKMSYPAFLAENPSGP